MKLATTPEEQRRWMGQWREAAVYLEEVRRYDLMTLTEAQAWRHIEAVQGDLTHDAWRNPDEPCGFLEQQALFQRVRR
jgi:hypothetical protein